MEIFIKRHLAACPGNLHPSGVAYELVGTGSVLRKNGVVEQAVGRLRSLGWKPGIWKKNGKLDLARIRGGVDKGQRADAAFWYAVHLLDCLNTDFDSVRFEMERWNALNRGPLPQRELEEQVSGAVKYFTRKRRKELQVGHDGIVKIAARSIRSKVLVVRSRSSSVSARHSPILSEFYEA